MDQRCQFRSPLRQASWRFAAVLVALGCGWVGTVYSGPPGPAGLNPAAPEKLPAPRQEAPHVQGHVVPISLDTVLRLAEEQNSQIGLARARVLEASAEKDVASRKWLPELYLGTAYYRHEGGIQDPNGDFVHSSTGAMFNGLEIRSKMDLREYAYLQISAERKAWQQKGELSRITSETLLEATTTYIDLLSARAGEAIAHKLEQDLMELLSRAEKLPKQAAVEVSRVRTEVLGRQQAIVRLHDQAAAASAKLVYLLGLDPCIELLPIDTDIVPFELVDVSAPTCELVGQALMGGPGVRELEGLLALIEKSIEESKGMSQFLPTVDFRSGEGLFGAGPGSSYRGDNRWDADISVRWNVTDLFTASDRRKVAMAQAQQAHLAYQDLRGKLVAGVQESRGAIISGHEQIRLGQDQIDNAKQAWALSNDRLVKTIPGSSYSEVLLSLQALAQARGNYLGAIREYDKAQLRLMFLVGCRLPPPAVPATPTKPQTLPAAGQARPSTLPPATASGQAAPARPMMSGVQAGQMRPGMPPAMPIQQTPMQTGNGPARMPPGPMQPGPNGFRQPQQQPIPGAAAQYLQTPARQNPSTGWPQYNTGQNQPALQTLQQRRLPPSAADQGLPPPTANGPLLPSIPVEPFPSGVNGRLPANPPQ